MAALATADPFVDLGRHGAGRKAGRGGEAAPRRRVKRGFQLSLRPGLLTALTSSNPSPCEPSTPEDTKHCNGNASLQGVDAVNMAIEGSHLSASSSGGSRRMARDDARQGSGRLTTQRDFAIGDADGEVDPEPDSPAPAEADPAVGPAKVKARRKSKRSSGKAAVEGKTTPAKPVTIKMHVIKRSKIAQPAPPVAVAAISPIAPQTLVKSRGCWYVEHTPGYQTLPSTPAATPAGLKTPATLAKAAGCWYLNGGASPAIPSIPSAPSTQLHARGCWYMRGAQADTPSPAKARKSASSPPPLAPSTMAHAKGAWYLDSGAASTGSKTRGGRSMLKRKADVAPADENINASARRRTSGGNPPGVLSELRNTYMTSRSRPPTGGTGKQRSNVSTSMTPYPMSPIPLCFNTGGEVEAAGGMDLCTPGDPQGSIAHDDHNGVNSGEGSSPDGHSAADDLQNASMQFPTPSVELSPRKGPAKARSRRSSIPNQRLRTAAKDASTPGIIGAGTKTVDGIRRSSRQKYEPLEFWRNEYKEYGRTHTSLPTVVDVHHQPPDSAWPMDKKPKARTSRRRK